MERQPALKVGIIDLHGKYVQKQGETPSYVETRFGNVVRANVIAVVIGKPTQNALLLDDGSQIECRAFDKGTQFAQLLPGDVAMVIGRPRTYEDKPYLVAEIVKKLTPQWLELRQKELSKAPAPIRQEKPVAMHVEEEPAQGSTPEEVVARIRELDTGDGAPVEDIKIANAEQLLTSLMAEGEIFEIRPGRVKVLE